jgi:hypothetical protein
MRTLNDSPGQRSRYFELVSKAWKQHCEQTGEQANSRAAETQFRREINMKATQCYSIKEMNQTTDFDAVMLELAIIAFDEYWIDRLSCSAERRLRWILRNQFIPDLEFLMKEQIGWEYITGICEQAKIPTRMDDCPAPMLMKIVQMVDTYIRRLAKKSGIDLIDLPSGYFRRGWKPSAAKAKFRHDHHHHVHHEPEHANA